MFKRMLAFVYGVACYLAFFATLSLCHRFYRKLLGPEIHGFRPTDATELCVGY